MPTRRTPAGRKPFAVALAAVLTAGVLAGAAPAGAAGEPPLPLDATLLVQGHGWGHARGMGQWGAQGMALDGKTAAEILTHYYTGIQITTRAAETIRALVERSSSDVVVTSERTYTARWRGGSTIAASTTAAPWMRATATADGYRLQRGASATGPWTTTATGTSPVVFAPGDAPLEIYFGGSSPCTWSVCGFRGTIAARKTSSTTVAAINEATMQQYLYGVVPREMPSSWRAAALEAQSIAARSYAARKKDTARERGSSYDICADTQCQVYSGSFRRRSPGGTKVGLETSATNAAIDSTAGKVMTSGGESILAEYSSSTGGWSVDGLTSYLRAVPDPADEISPHHDWAAKIGVSEIETRWPAIGRLTGVRVLDRFGCTECEWGGRVSRMALDGTDGSVEITGSTLRSTFEWPSRSSGIKSTWFRVLTWRGELVSAPASVSVAAGGTTAVEAQIRNTGTAWWSVGGPVRLAAGSDRFADASWVSPTRAASVTRNVSDPASNSVRPGEVAAFRFTLDASEVAAGTYRETFEPVADGYSSMDPSLVIEVTVLSPWIEDLPSLVANPSFEDGLAAWTGVGLHTGDGSTGADARGGERSLRLTGGGIVGAKQTVAAGGRAGRRLVLGAWSRTAGSSASGGYVGVTAALRNVDRTTTWVQLPFPSASHGWRYDEVSFAAPKPFRHVDVFTWFQDQTGTAYFDDVRLLDSVVVNPSFEEGLDGWTAARTTAADGIDSAAVRDGNRSLHLTAGADKSFVQRIAVGGVAGSRWLLAGWARTAGTNPLGGRVALAATFRNRDGTATKAMAAFERAPHDWAYVEAPIRAEKDFWRVDVFAVLYGQTGEAWFDGVRFASNGVENPSFERGTSGWTASGALPVDTATETLPEDAARSLEISGGARKVFSQQVSLRGGTGTTVLVAGWTQSTGTTPGQGRIGITVALRSPDGRVEWYRVDAATAPHPWTSVERRITAPRAFTRADVYLVVENQTGTARFDGIRLTIE